MSRARACLPMPWLFPLMLLCIGVTNVRTVHATDATLKVEPGETTLPSTASDCGLSVLYGWRLVNVNTPINAPVKLEGQVVEGYVATTDFGLVHNRADYNWYVYPDSIYRGLLTTPGSFEEGEDVGKGRLECEWELWKTSWWGGMLPYAWPTMGDRIILWGSHIMDCGHGKGLLNPWYRSEIHPPRLIAVFRNAAQSVFNGVQFGQGTLWYFAANGQDATPATRVDIFGSSYGGHAIKNIYTDRSINLSELYPATSGPATWWQPINDRDYEFDVHAPPKPSPSAQLVIEPYDISVLNVPISFPTVTYTQLLSGDGYHVKISSTGWTDQPTTHLNMVMKTIYVGWAGTPAEVPRLPQGNLRQYKVTMENVHINHDLDPDVLVISDAGEFGLYWYVNEKGGSLFSGGGVNSVAEPYKYVYDGNDIAAFDNRTFTVTLLPDQPLRIHFQATESDATYDDEGGVADTIFVGDDAAWAGMSHTLRSGTDGHMGGEDQDSYCNGTEGCYTVTFHVERVTPSVDVPVDRMIRVADAVEVLGNPSTTNNVSFRIANNTPGRVRAEVFDVSGRRVRTVVDRDCPAGIETLVWDGADEAGRRVQQGAYFLRVVIGDGRFTSTKRLVLLR